MVQRIIALGRLDALTGSVIACHPRPVNNLPETPCPGFVARSYECFDAVVRKHVGKSLDIDATEFGYEPGDAANTELPPINEMNHATYNVKLAQMEWRPCLRTAYYWTWLNDWFNSGWWRGDVQGSLPVVRAFMAMPKTAVTMTSEAMRRLAEAHGQEIRIFTGGLLYTEAQRRGLGYPVTNEWTELGRIWQRYEHPAKRTKSVGSCRAQVYDDVQFVTWPME
jgi:hypothetical protein